MQEYNCKKLGHSEADNRPAHLISFPRILWDWSLVQTRLTTVTDLCGIMMKIKSELKEGNKFSCSLWGSAALQECLCACACASGGVALLIHIVPHSRNVLEIERPFPQTAFWIYYINSCYYNSWHSNTDTDNVLLREKWLYHNESWTI
jgi:hypothetical protein